MNRSLTHSFPAKVGGVFLSVILAFLLVLSGAGILAAWQFGIYESGVSSYYDTDLSVLRRGSPQRQGGDHPQYPGQDPAGPVSVCHVLGGVPAAVPDDGPAEFC